MGAIGSALETHRALDVPSTRAVESPCAAAWVGTPLSGIVFDVADVLYDASLWRRWLVRLVNRMGLAVDYEAFCRVWHDQYQRDVHSGRREFSEALHSFLLAWGLSWAQIDEIEAASRIQCENIGHNGRALPGIVKTVARLSERRLPLLAWADMPYPAGKATELVGRLGLRGCFQFVLSSFDLGCAQPSVESYRSILEAFRLPAGEVAYVGHDGGKPDRRSCRRISHCHPQRPSAGAGRFPPRPRRRLARPDRRLVDPPASRHRTPPA